MWGNAFLKQARSDWKAYTEMQKLSLDNCHRLYYLRATTEKLGKAAMLKSGSQVLEDVSHNHKIFVRFLQISRRNTNLAKALNVNNQQLQGYINNILPLAQRIENLVPQGNNSPNAEYPWQDTAGELFSPSDYKFPEINDLSSPSGRNFLTLVRLILEKFETVY
jgi:hypothetical protein